jgi:protocatechuate 3,4-dioxygenase beta subunit
MLKDDAMVGRLLTRREAVALLGLSGIAVMGEPVFGQAPESPLLPSCVVQPEQTEGPYFVDKVFERTDIRQEPGTGALKAGLPLNLTFAVSLIGAEGTCAPLPGAQVDVWQCDAAGIYSGVKDSSFDTTGEKFLRGFQTTDARGMASFVTIYPGWYPGRAVHVHFKIRTTPAGERGYEFTSQLYFDESLTDRVFEREPYSERKGQRTRNESDGIFRDGGRQLVLPVTESADSYAGTFSLALNPALPSRSGRGGRGGRAGR